MRGVKGSGVFDVLNSAAAVATICSAVIAFLSLVHQLTRPRRTSGRRRAFGLNRNEVLLILCITLFFFLGLAVPQSIFPLFAVLLLIVYWNMPGSTNRARYTLSILAVTLAGLIGAYLSAYDVVAKAGLPLFYSHDFRILDIWYLLN